MQLTENAIAAGLTQDDADFMEGIMPKMLLGMMLETVLITPPEIKRMVGLADKLKAADPDSIFNKPDVTALMERVRKHGDEAIQ